ncbi:MAG: VanW family protein [Lachnospiraceae bacterium]|nr:VanW family protein [Lachnospiraceae bacterium]
MNRKILKKRLAALWLPVVFLYIFAMSVSAQEQVISKGIFIQGVDCAGMNKDQAAAAIDQKVAELGAQQVTITVGDQSTSCTLAQLGLTWTNRDVLNDMLELGSSGNIVQRYKDRKDLEHTTRQFSLTFTADEAAATAVAQTLTAYNTEPVNARIFTRDDLTPGVEGGTEGISVNVAETAAALKNAVTAWDGSSPISIEASAERIKPDVPYEELAIISDVLGTATTDYSASSWGRAINVENGCRKISGTLLYPGEEFSVTAAVTPFTAENGYEQAPSYEENRVVDSYGGGICQVSTTLYNAVLKSELQVTARSNHTMVVAYVPLSKDAAIAEGVMDMAFINTKDDPIYIIGYTYGGTITFTIFGHETRPANRTLEFESRTIQTIEPTQAKLFANAGQSVGYINQTQSPHTGYVAELWKNVYVDGQLVDSVQVNRSEYTAVGTIYDIGVASQVPAVTQAMYGAISSGSLSAVQEVIANAVAIQQQAESEAAAQAAAEQAAQQMAYEQDPSGMLVIGEGGDVDESLSP